MIKRLTQLVLCVASGILVQCKDDVVKPSPLPNTACVIASERSNLIGNEASWQYEYTPSGIPSKITRADKFGNITDILEIFGNYVKKSKMESGNPTGTAITTTYDEDYLTSSPLRSSVAITMNGITTLDYEIFIFTYDYKNRVHVITQQTPNVFNDLEWELTISYNDNDNVIKLLYELNTSPRVESSVIIVEGYDDHPTPFAGVLGWKFLMYNYTWNNYDPGPVITALSKNNPLHYTFYTNGIQQSETTVSYEYNIEGFPTTRTNTNKNENGESSHRQDFNYSCK